MRPTTLFRGIYDRARLSQLRAALPHRRDLSNAVPTANGNPVDDRKQTQSRAQERNQLCRGIRITCEIFLGTGAGISRHLIPVSSGFELCPFFVLNHKPGPEKRLAGALAKTGPATGSVKRIQVRPVANYAPYRDPPVVYDSPLLTLLVGGSDSRGAKQGLPENDWYCIASDQTLSLMVACSGKLLFGLWADSGLSLQTKTQSSAVASNTNWNGDVRRLAFIQPLIHPQDLLDWIHRHLWPESPFQSMGLSRSLLATNTLYISMQWGGNTSLFFSSPTTAPKAQSVIGPMSPKSSQSNPFLNMSFRLVRAETQTSTFSVQNTTFASNFLTGSVYYLVHPNSMKAAPRLNHPSPVYNWTNGLIHGSIRHAGLIHVTAWDPQRKEPVCSFVRLLSPKDYKQDSDVISYFHADRFFEFGAVIHTSAYESIVREMYLKLPN